MTASVHARGLLLRWEGDALVVDRAAAPAPHLLAAGSFVVDEGRVLAAERHRARFLGSVRRPAQEAVAFWDAALGALPTQGRWFPRVEHTHEGLALRLRPAPARDPGPLTVRVRLQRDPRLVPRIKGPDLPLLGALRDESRSGGADELLLTTAGGLLLEGTTAGLLWWEGNTLCHPAEHLPLLPSTTSAAIRALARESGCAVRARVARIEALAGREAWLVNALHGIRPVRRWLGVGDVPAGEAVRAEAWQARLLAEARPVDRQRPALAVVGAGGAT